MRCGDVQAKMDLPTSTENAAQPASEPEGKPLCRSCAAPNEPNADFCAKCGAPLSWYFTIGPFESIFAQGFVYREAAERPRRFIVVAGIWLIFLPQVLVGIGMLVFNPGFGWNLVATGLILISIAIIGRSTWNYISQKRQPSAQEQDR
jgi:zinc-ribbon domain